MVIVVATISVDPSDRPRYLEGKRAQVAASLREPGCLDYAFSADGTDPGTVRLLEQWASMADLDAHVTALMASREGTEAPIKSTMTSTVYEAVEATPPWA